MTFTNSLYVSNARLTILHSLAKLPRKWRERRRYVHMYQKLSDMPVYLLRDVGLEHLRDLKPDPKYPHRML